MAFCWTAALTENRRYGAVSRTGRLRSCRREISRRSTSTATVGKVDWPVLDHLPAIHGSQFFCDAVTAVGRRHLLGDAAALQ